MLGRSRNALPVVLATVLVLTAGTVGCATTRSDSEGTRSDILTREEIMGAQGARNLYDVVQRLRPRWLVARATSRSFQTSTGIVIYQNQVYQGGPETLRQFDRSSAYQLRFMDGPTASASLSGLPGQHVAGAIIISTSPPGD